MIMAKILITGIFGFIGSHLARESLRRGYKVKGFGRLSEHRNIKRIGECKIDLVVGDLTNINDMCGIMEGVDYVINCGAKTFVDHSIRDYDPYYKSNVEGTRKLLEQAIKYKVKRYIQVSTDEVYGEILEGEYKETAELKPRNPYSVSKAQADLEVLMAGKIYGLDVIVTRTENNYGYWQDYRKVIPKFVKYGVEGKPFPVYGDGRHSRMWLRVEDHCKALIMLLKKGKSGEIYHIAGHKELQNIELAERIKEGLGLPDHPIEHIDDKHIRPGHDRRYALNCDKIKELGWQPEWELNEGIKDAVLWYKEHYDEWLKY